MADDALPGRSAPLAGRVALVMGAGDAAAAATAVSLAEAGADVALTTASPSGEEAFAVQRLARRIEDAGRRALAESVDLANGASVQVAVRQVARQMGRLDLLVVAADQPQGRATERLGDADWARVVNGNLGAVFFACRAAFRELQSRPADAASPGGRIVVFLPSVRESAASGAAYIACKVGVQALVRALAAEWQERGVSVNAVLLPAGATGDRAAAAAARTALQLLAEQTTPITGEVIVAREA
jgi:3-oxoacyl-[acyl-carrier protein] reductase